MPNCNSDVFSYGWTISNYMGNEMMNGYELSALFFSMMAGMALMIWAMKRTTNTNETNNKYSCFYHGKYFDSPQDMTEYARKWPDLPADLEYYRVFLDQRMKEAEMNVQANPEFTNRHLFSLLMMHTEWAKNELD